MPKSAPSRTRSLDQIVPAKIAVGIMTHNSFSSLRTGVLDETVKSAIEAFPSSPILVFDNHSTDGSEDLIHLRWDGVDTVRHLWGSGTPGAGRKAMLKHMSKRQRPAMPGTVYDIFVCCDDDMRWSREAGRRLSYMWPCAPAELLIISGLLEPVWPWNKPKFTVEHGDTSCNVLVRESAPGAAWSCRASEAEYIAHHIEDGFGYDTKLCAKLGEFNALVAQADLSTHIGEEFSTHGNRPHDNPKTKALDREKWRI